MTPDIHTKTYAERSGLGGIASGMSGHGGGSALGGGSTSVHHNHPPNTSITQQLHGSTYANALHHASAKNNKNGNQHLMGLTIGGSGIGTNSMIAGIGNQGGGTNNSNLGMYAPNNQEQEKKPDGNHPNSANAHGSNATNKDNKEH